MAFRRLHHAFKHLRSTATAALLPPDRRSRHQRRRILVPGIGLYRAEPLEPRTLLTTITGFGTTANGGDGDLFEYRDETDQVIRVKATGNINAELIGARVDRRTNEIELVNLPGNLNGTPVFGGLDPAPGLQNIGVVFIAGFTTNIAAIAAAPDGTVYGINTIVNYVDPLTGQFGTANQIVQLSIPASGMGTVVGTVLGTIFTPAGTNNPNLPLLVTGADVDANGLLYFVGTTPVATTNLFSVNPTLPTPAQVEASLQTTGPLNLPPGPNNTPPPVTSIGFNRAGQLVGIYNGNSQFTINVGSGFNTVPVPILNQANAPVENVVGIDTNPANGDTIAIQSGDNAAVFDVNDFGGSFNLGLLGTTTASGLAFVPGLEDFFTGNTQGAFVGINGVTDQLFFVNAEDRLPAQFLWNVYVRDSDLTGQIAIGFVRGRLQVPPPTPNVIRPLEGAAGEFQVTNAQGGPDIIIPLGPGGALIGARTQDIFPNVDTEQLRPFEIADVPSEVNLGLFPDNITELRPGLIVEQGADLGKFLLGGTFTGAADIRGSIDLFAVNMLLTGNVNGQNSEFGVDVPDNFRVAGDIRNLLVRTSIGSNLGTLLDEPTYVTGFDMQVGGTVGEVAAGDFSRPGGFYGSIEVNHLDPKNNGGSLPHIERNQFEAEYHVIDPDLRLIDGFENFNYAYTDDFSFNDTFNTPEYLGSIASGELGRSEVVRLSGSLDIRPTAYLDPVDFYAVSLMAGQRYTARVEGSPEGFLNLGVFDPDGRLVATDVNNTDITQTQEKFFSFTADRPGVYRFAVTLSTNVPDFSALPPTLVGPPIGYTLTVLGIGDVALGGVVANATIFDIADPFTYDPGFEIFRGDMGVFKSYTGNVLSANVDTIVVENGNLRAIDAVNIGIENETVFGQSPTVDVPRGSVGLLRASTATEIVEQDALGAGAGDPVGASTSILAFNLGNERPIGGDYQVIDGPEANVHVHLFANRAIGTIRGFSMGAINDASILTVNADDRGEDGTIDLIDIFEDLGTLTAGGPQITTNTGGNVRYIRVLGDVFRDVFFGGGQPEQTFSSVGETVSIRDDSGASVRFTPIGEARPSIFFNPALPDAGADPFIGPTTQVTTYPIRDAGGSAIIDVTSDGGLTIDVDGASTAEIGRVEIRGIGQELINGEDVEDNNSIIGTREVFELTSGLPPEDDQEIDGGDIDGQIQPRVRPEDLSLFVRGTARVDILNVVVVETGGDSDGGDTNENQLDNNGFYGGELLTDLPDLIGWGNAVTIANDTPGEIVNIVSESIAELRSGGTLGMARSHTGAAVVGLEPITMANSMRVIGGRQLREVQSTGSLGLGNFGPFLGETHAILAMGGNIGSIRAAKAIGNVAVNGSIGDVVANADGQDDPEMFEGINGVVSTYGFQAVDQPVGAGRIFDIDIGEGVLPSGSGNFTRAGIIAYDGIRRVSGTNADIRGDIQALNRVVVPGLQAVQSPKARRVGEITTDVDGNTTTVTEISVNRPYGIEAVVLNGGSIINSDIIITTNREDLEEFDAGIVIPEGPFPDPIDAPYYDLARIGISGNGGIIGARILGPDIGSVKVNPGGFGILNTTVGGLADDRVNRIEASGYGLRGMLIDPSGSLGSLIANGDGTSLSTNAISASVRQSEREIEDPLVGLVDPFFELPPSTLTDIHMFLGTNKDQPEISGVTDTGVIEAVEAIGQRDLGTVKAWQIRGDSILDFANSTRNLIVQDVINGLELTTGTLKNFKLQRDAFDLTVSVRGRVKKVDIRGSLAGGSVIRTVGDGGQFDSVNVSGNLIGNIESSRAIKNITIGGDFTGNVKVKSGGMAIKSMKVGGAFISGSLDIEGNLGTLQTKGSLGSIGDTLTINGSVNKIMVGGDLRSNIRVTGNLKNLTVRGSIVDGGLENGLLIDVSDTFGSLNVGGDIQPGVTINARKFGRQRIGGLNAGTIVTR